MTGKVSSSTLLILVCLAVTARASDWPQFRGNNGSATSPAKDLPAAWDADKNVAWKIKLPGYGWSSPIVWGDKVFVTTAVSDKQKKPSSGFGGFGGGVGKGGYGKGKRPSDDIYQWQIYCLSAADGKVLWKETPAERKPAISIFPSNTYASETPVTDGERVYAHFGAIGLVVCYDFAGKQVWKKDLGTYKIMFGHGSGASPTLHEGRLFIQCDNEEKSFLVALDAKTGDELWRVKRSERTGWSTPLIWKNKVRTELVCLGSPRVRSYDPATGKQLWELGGMSGQVKASPVASADLLYVGTGGFGFSGFGGGGFGGGGKGGSKPLMAVKAGASGDITQKEAVAWQLPQAGPATASPLLYEGYLYVLEERSGLLSCYDAKNGKKVYKERLQGARGFTSSPWAYDGKVFCLDDSGTTHVVQAGPKFKVLANNTIEEMCWSSPAIGTGALFLRTVDHLYCIKTKGGNK
jgi:outer membrane protein assembly factor BamB